MGGFNQNGSAVFPEVANESFKRTANYSAATASWNGGWTAGNNHMASGTVVSGVLVEANTDSKKSIVIYAVLASSDQGLLASPALCFTLAQEGESGDLIRLSCNGGAPAKWEGAVKLAAGKDLILCRGTCSGTGSVSVSYTYV